MRITITLSLSPFLLTFRPLRDLVKNDRVIARLLREERERTERSMLDHAKWLVAHSEMPPPAQPSHAVGRLLGRDEPRQRCRGRR